MTTPQSPIQAALAAEREQWTGPTRTCEELGVCQDKQPPCERCMPAEGHESVKRLLDGLGKRPNLPPSQGVK